MGNLLQVHKSKVAGGKHSERGGGRASQAGVFVTQLQDMFPSVNFEGLFYENLSSEKDY